MPATRTIHPVAFCGLLLLAFANQTVLNFCHSLSNFFKTFYQREDKPLHNVWGQIPLSIAYLLEWTSLWFFLHKRRLANAWL